MVIELFFLAIRLIACLPSQFHRFTLIGGNGSIVSDNNEIQTQLQPESFNVIKHVINQYDLNYIVDDKIISVLMLQIQLSTPRSHRLAQLTN